MKGGWFWWCPERDGQWPAADRFGVIWRDMFEYFTKEKELDNLLWVYSPAVQTQGHHRSAAYYYPGAEFVDLVSLDWYTDNLSELDRYGSYTQLAGLDKPMGLAEFGPLTQRDGSFDSLRVVQVVADHPKLRFIQFWHSWPNNKMSIIDQQNAADLMKRSEVIDRRELQSLR